MSLDHDIPTHLDVEDRPALGLTAKQLLLLAGGLFAAIGALRQPHLPLVIRIATGATPLGLALLIVYLRPANRSLIAWVRVALLHLTGPRAFAWASSRPTASLPSGPPVRPPHLAPSVLPPSGSNARPSRDLQRCSPHPAAQEQRFVPYEIAGDMVTFRDGRHCAVLECNGTNTALMGEDALRATHAAYHAFLAGLPWPLQLLVWASPVDLRPYRAAREARLTTLSPELRSLESADIAFMEREARRSGLLDHRLFVVIPASGYAGTTVPMETLLATLRTRLRPPALMQSDNEVAIVLEERCERVTTELAAAGVYARRLSTEALRALWRRLLAPRSVHLQPLSYGNGVPGPMRLDVTFSESVEEPSDD